MSAKDLTSRTQSAKPDEFIQDYLSDIWGISSVDQKEIQSESRQEYLSSGAVQSVEKGLSLVPTLKYPLSGVRTLTPQADLLVLLFSYLYLLRRPLSPRVRQLILDTAEQVIEDYQAGFWLHELSGKGAYCEV